MPAHRWTMMAPMHVLDRAARWSATELVDFFTCAHRVTLEGDVRAGRRERPAPSGEAAVVARRGLQHETAYRESLSAAGLEIVEIVRPFGAAEYARAAAETRAALARGADAIAGATFSSDAFAGISDLVRRVPGTSAFGPWTYEIVDIRLAARSGPAAIVQACANAEALAALCGTPVDDARMHVVLADGSTQTFAVAAFAAFFRSLRARMQAERGGPRVTRPDKIEACGRCRWNETCAEERVRTDDVSLVANARRSDVLALRAAGLTTVATLAAAAGDARPAEIAPGTWQRLHDQASLQAQAAADGVLRYQLLQPEARGGFALLPAPSFGDVYFDMEGDPFVRGKLEYLFGLGWRDGGGSAHFHPVWAHTREAERAALGEVLAFVRARREADPAMHVYHYAPYERTALTRLAAGTAHEGELDALFRDEVFVDLYAVVRGALRVATPSYSIKALELFYRGHKRSSDVADAMGSVVAYEEYLRTNDLGILEDIRVYNQDDVDSTRELHDWLLERKAEAYAAFGPPPAPADGAVRETPEDAELDALRATLGARATHDVLLADLLEYHRREKRPVWREYFERLRNESHALFDDPKCLAGLIPAAGIAPVPIDRSHGFALDFPDQVHGFRRGDMPVDPATGQGAGEILELTPHPGGGRVVLKRGPKLATTALPAALIPKDIFHDAEARAAIRRFAQAVAGGAGPLGAQAALLARERPRLRSGRVPAFLDATTPAGLADAIDDLDEGVLVVQGPPGTGKTCIAARAIVQLLECGRRIGVASGAHKAINNLLGEIERVAGERGYALRGVKKSDASRPDTCYDSPSGAIVDVFENQAFPPEQGVRLIAGTPALFARQALSRTVDVLVVDEAGQLALADAVAIAQAARSIVLVGDPQQLPHITVGLHPAGAGASVLAHMLDGASTVPADRGVLLPRSYRMHPEIARFVSELMYDGRLTGAPACERQRIVAPGTALDGAGLRTLEVVHAGRSSAAPEEADAIAGVLAELAGSEVVDADGTQRPFLAARDAIVVAPYNAQVAAIRAALARASQSAVRVGTVDKFQGQEATVVLYSMTTSSGDDVPHDVEFLFDRHRLNVAISRARTLAVVVHSPALLTLRPRTVEQLALLNALARFRELATPLAPRAPA